MNEHDDEKRIAELEADNRRLRRLLDEHGAPSELRHRSRSTLALLRAIIRNSSKTKGDVETYVAHLEDRLDAISRAHSVADEHGCVDLETLLREEFQFYQAVEGSTFFLEGPAIEFRPRPGQAFALAAHELAVNAVEHGALGANKGVIRIAWRVLSVGSQLELHLVWNESGSDGPYQNAGSREMDGFGTDVLTKMLRYELKADTELDFQKDQFYCTIRVLLTPDIGVVVAA